MTKPRLKTGATPMDVAYIKRRTLEGVEVEEISRECGVIPEVVKAFASAAGVATSGEASPTEVSVKRRRRSTKQD